MTRLGKLLVDRHWDIVKVVLPCSMAFGFVYTMNHGRSPLVDARQMLMGSGSGDFVTVRFNAGSMGGQRSA